MSIHSPNFADAWEIRELLNISKSQLAALDHARIYDGKVIGVDNVQKLMVSTVFACIAIEAALNDFLQVHCLLPGFPYLQSFFADLMQRFLRGGVHPKIDLLLKSWSEPFPDDLIKDVRELFRIRNRVIHATGRLVADAERSHGLRSLSNDPLSSHDLQHMLRHHEIAEAFLQHFWTPGTRQLQQGMTEEEREVRGLGA